MRRNPSDWIEAGFQLLRKSGAWALTLEALCEKMKRTRGSFYHHFKDMADFKERLLDHWVQKDALAIIYDSDAAGETVRERRITLENLANATDRRLETEIRRWAGSEPMAAQAASYIDDIRTRYLQALYEDEGYVTSHARLLAEIEYAAFVGMKYIAAPDADEKRAKKLTYICYQALRKLPVEDLPPIEKINP